MTEDLLLAGQNQYKEKLKQYKINKLAELHGKRLRLQDELDSLKKSEEYVIGLEIIPNEEEVLFSRTISSKDLYTG